MADSDRGDASVIIPVKGPDVQALAMTLDSIADQDYPIREILIMDGSDDPIEASVDGIETRVIPDDSDGQGWARRNGLREASGEYVVHLDEDAILLNPDYISEAVKRIEEDDSAVAAGGTVVPLRGNRTGDVIAILDRANPSTLGTHHLVHRRYVCFGADGEVCFPVERRGEDITLRNALKQSGGIVRMYDQPAMKDLPTERQSKGISTILFSIAGGVASSIVTSAVERAFRQYGEDALEAATEEVTG